MKRRLAILPGSFDPMTLGHLDIVRKVSQDFEQIVVAVMINPAKTSMFDLKERVKIAEATVSEFPNVRVISDRGMLIDLFDKLGADAVCKGIRDQKDYEYEVHMAEWNRAHNPRFRTEFYQSDPALSEISSTMVRDLLHAGKSPAKFVHPAALPLVLEKRTTEKTDV